MNNIILSKYHTWSKYRDYNFKRNTFFDEYKSDIRKIDGIYFNEINALIAVFSNEGKNYLLIDNKQIILTKDISSQYYCGERQEKSWIKIFDKENLIFELKYVNPTQEPFIDFFLEFEDWEVVNFAYHLAGYINKVRDNPNIVLFSNE